MVDLDKVISLHWDPETGKLLGATIPGIGFKDWNEVHEEDEKGWQHAYVQIKELSRFAWTQHEHIEFYHMPNTICSIHAGCRVIKVPC